MDKQKKRMARIAAVLAILALLAGAVTAAGEGTQADPLVTLSYVTKTVIPAILEQVDGKAAAYQQELVGKLDQAIQAYAAKMDEIVGEEGGDQHAAVYTVVTLKKDQQMKMDIGCEVMLRVGTAQCVSSSDPGLIDTTAGTALNNGKDLVTNHLYMATIAGRAVKATAGTVKVLVRGGYTIA